ncbi:hypothetical protein PC116_g18414 [Phytophthora cactorum]|nr:hypothetical protein PC119_g15244 [Phytophthora cactorum]KAG4233379.1 hypothetical protein PC116_g18414 [Phytophthora cactorum]
MFFAQFLRKQSCVRRPDSKCKLVNIAAVFLVPGRTLRLSGGRGLVSEGGAFDIDMDKCGLRLVVPYVRHGPRKLLLKGHGGMPVHGF